jgi:hypothetical protein
MSQLSDWKRVRTRVRILPGSTYTMVPWYRWYAGTGSTPASCDIKKTVRTRVPYHGTVPVRKYYIVMSQLS